MGTKSIIKPYNYYLFWTIFTRLHKVKKHAHKKEVTKKNYTIDCYK